MTEPTENIAIEPVERAKPKCGKIMRKIKFLLFIIVLLFAFPYLYWAVGASYQVLWSAFFANQTSGSATQIIEISETQNGTNSIEPLAEENKSAETAKEQENENVIALTPNTTLTTNAADGNNGEANNEDRLQKLEDKISKLEAELSELKTKQETEKSISNQNVGLLPSLVVFGQLKDAVLSGKPYHDTLQQIRTLSENNSFALEILDKLIENSENGMIPESELIKQYSPLAHQVMVGKNAGWIQKNSQKFITIRKVGEQEGKDDEAVLARAETILNAHPVYLYKALAELETLSPNAKEVFADWLKNAGKLQETKGSLERLQFILTRQPNKPAVATENKTKIENNAENETITEIKP